MEGGEGGWGGAGGGGGERGEENVTWVKLSGGDGCSGTYGSGSRGFRRNEPP